MIISKKNVGNSTYGVTIIFVKKSNKGITHTF